MPFRIDSLARIRLSRCEAQLLLALVAAFAPAAPIWAQMEHKLFITDAVFTINPASETTPQPIGSSFGGLLSADFQCTQAAYFAGLLPD
jgi:hypothetical protein